MMRRLAAERGAAAIMVAILLGSGFLILSVGLVIDGGRLYLERRVLQTNADTVAVSVAQACASKELNPALTVAADCQNPPSNIATAMGLTTSARVPNEPQQSEAYLACGTTATFTTCPTTSIGNYDCKSPVDSVSGSTFAHAVRVYTRTTEAGATGGTALYPVFAPLLQAAPNGTRMAACSQTAWVYRSIAKVPNSTYMPFAISQCEYGETAHVIVGYYASTATCASAKDHSGSLISCGVGGCSGGVVGFNYSLMAGCAVVSGGKLSLFGTTNTIGAPSSNICVKSTIGSAPSPGLGNLQSAINGTFSNTVTPEGVYTVPIYDKLTTGTNNKIRISGFGYFHLLGYKFPGSTFLKAGQSTTWPTSCGLTGGAGNTWCVYGYFEPHVYSNSPNSELTEISRPTFWDGTYAIKRIP